MSNVGLPDRQEPQADEQIDQREGLQASDAAGGPAQPPDALQTADPRYRPSQITASLNQQVTRSSHISSCVSFCQPADCRWHCCCGWQSGHESTCVVKLMDMHGEFAAPFTACNAV